MDCLTSACASNLIITFIAKLVLRTEVSVLSGDQLMYNSMKCEHPETPPSNPEAPPPRNVASPGDLIKGYKVPEATNNWKSEVKRIWNKPVEQLPIGIDLPRLATSIFVTGRDVTKEPAPEDAAPNAAVSDAAAPDAAAPDAATPDAVAPDAAVPNAAEPDAAATNSATDAAVSDVAITDAAAPDAAADTTPDAAPDATKDTTPDAAQSADAASDGVPVATTPAAATPAAATPEPTQSVETAQPMEITPTHTHGNLVAPVLPPEEEPDPKAREILHTLTHMARFIEGEEYTQKLRENFGTYVMIDGPKDRDMSREVSKLVSEYLGKESRLVKILKACNQAIIAPAVIELTLNVCAKVPFKDAGGWRMELSKNAEGQFTITHVKLQKSRSNNKEEEFDFEWHLEIIFDDTLSGLSDVYLTVPKLNFGPSVSQTTMEGIQYTFAPYLVRR